MATETVTFGPPPCVIKKIYRGNWCGFYSCHPVDGYLGLEFHIKGSTHYGWAHMIVTPSDYTFVSKLTGFAYETIPRKSIKAGRISGKARRTIRLNEDSGATAFLTGPTPDNPQPASLSILARGARGVPLCRRKENESGTKHFEGSNQPLPLERCTMCARVMSANKARSYTSYHSYQKHENCGDCGDNSALHPKIRMCLQPA